MFSVKFPFDVSCRPPVQRPAYNSSCRIPVQRLVEISRTTLSVESLPYFQRRLHRISAQHKSASCRLSHPGRDCVVWPRIAFEVKRRSNWFLVAVAAQRGARRTTYVVREFWEMSGWGVGGILYIYISFCYHGHHNYHHYHRHCHYQQQQYHHHHHTITIVIIISISSNITIIAIITSSSLLSPSSLWGTVTAVS